jgi:hypothetical protein
MTTMRRLMVAVGLLAGMLTLTVVSEVRAAGPGESVTNTKSNYVAKGKSGGPESAYAGTAAGMQANTRCQVVIMWGVYTPGTNTFTNSNVGDRTFAFTTGNPAVASNWATAGTGQEKVLPNGAVGTSVTHMYTKLQKWDGVKYVDLPGPTWEIVGVP